MIWTLLCKELRQHWLALLLAAILTLAGYGLIVIKGMIAGDEGSVLVGVRLFVMSLVTLCALVICHRLVVVEYSGRTQLFLEALPVSCWWMVAVKYVLGLVLVLGVVVIALGLACLVGWSKEVLSPRYVVIVATRAISAALCAYHFFFVMGFLGRYRLALYLAVLLGCFAVDELTDLKLDRFGPFALLDERFPFEGERFPWDALRVTWGLNAAFLSIAFLLALTREGAVASLLAEKMSHREKVFIAALLVGLVFAVSVLEEKKTRAPFDLHDAVTERRAGVVAKVAARPSDKDPAESLGRHVADELAAMREYLGLGNLPPVFITRRRDLDADRYERGELEDASGVHLQANFGASEFDRAEFTAWLRREVLLAHTQDRAKLEPKMWVLDGFALFDGMRDRATDPLTQDKTLALRALYGQELGFESGDLSRWHSFRERVGGDIAAGVAWSGLKTLARRAGPERCQNFLRAVLGVEVPRDFRALLRERSAKLEHLLMTQAGLTLGQFWSLWQEELASMRRELADDLAQLPKLRAEVIYVPLSAESRQIRYRVRIEPPPDRAPYSFLHHQLPVFDEEVAPQSIHREQNLYPQRREGELPHTFARGTRLYWTFSLDVPALGCSVISGWKRDEIR